jgi:VanZ family protein
MTRSSAPAPRDSGAHPPTRRSAKDVASAEFAAAGNEPLERAPAFAPLWWGVGWALVLLILYGTLAPVHYVPDLHLNDKLEHAAAFFGMTCWFGGLVRRRRYAALIFWMLLLGAGIEVAQGLMGLGRDADIRDFAADSIGVAAASLLVYIGLGSWTAHIERVLGIA